MNYDEQSLFREYQNKKEIFSNLKNTAITDIRSLLEKNNICVNNVVGRVKTFESFYQKIENMADGGKKLDSPCNDVQDIVGVRIVLLFAKDLDRIQGILEPTFKIETDRKRFSDQRKDDQFGYESDHYVLVYNEVKGPHYNEIVGVKFELQVRTVLMDAWDSVSHELDYKNKESIPSELKRVFYGLSGLFVVADQQFQQLKESIKEKKQEQAKKMSSPQDLLDQEINLDTLKAYLKYKFPDRLNVGKDTKKDEKKIDEIYSQVVKEIKTVGGYNSLFDIDVAINETIELVYKYEKNDFKKIFFASIGLLRTSLSFYDSSYNKLVYGERKIPFSDEVKNKKKR